MSSDVDSHAAQAAAPGNVVPERARHAAANGRAADVPRHLATMTDPPAGPPMPAESAPPGAVRVEPEPLPEVPAPSATKRVRARIARRMSGQRSTPSPTRTVLEPLFAVHRSL